MIRHSLQILLILLVFITVLGIITTQKVLAQAKAFCDKEVVIGQSSVGLIAKSKNAKSKISLSSADSLDIYFTGSYRPAVCKVSLKGTIITAKQVEMAD